MRKRGFLSCVGDEGEDCVLDNSEDASSATSSLLARFRMFTRRGRSVEDYEQVYWLEFKDVTVL